MWHHTLADTDVVAQTLFSRPSPVRERFLRMSAPVAALLVRRDYRITSESADRGREAVRAAMDRLESEVGTSGYLVGDGFTVADLTAASLFTPLLTPPERPYAPTAFAPAVQELRDELMARPGGAWVATDVRAPSKPARDRKGRCTQPLTPPRRSCNSSRATRSA